MVQPQITRQAAVEVFLLQVGLGANVAYTAALTVPGWDSLVTQHLMSHQRAPGGMYLALVSLLGFAALYNLHGVCQVGLPELQMQAGWQGNAHNARRARYAVGLTKRMMHMYIVGARRCTVCMACARVDLGLSSRTHMPRNLKTTKKIPLPLPATGGVLQRCNSPPPQILAETSTEHAEGPSAHHAVPQPASCQLHLWIEGASTHVAC